MGVRPVRSRPPRRGRGGSITAARNFRHVFPSHLRRRTLQSFLSKFVTIVFLRASGRAFAGGLRWLQSPLAFACPRLESEFNAAQRTHFQRKASIFMTLIAIISLTCWARMFPGQLDNAPLHAWNTTYVVALAICMVLLHHPYSIFSGAWCEIAIFIRLLCCMQAIVTRTIFPEELGRDRLLIASVLRDYLHAGGCLVNLAFPSLGLPLPYWAHLAAQLLSATFTAAQNGWLCVERLDSSQLPDRVKLHQALLRSLTFASRALLGTTNRVLEPYEETAIGSCEACVAAFQWISGLAFMQYQVYCEYCMRRNFLAAKSQNCSVQAQRTAFLTWPFGCHSGIYKLVIAFGAPIVAFAATWQAWLIMLHWLVQEWHVDGHTRVGLLRLPYAFVPSGTQ